MDDYCLAIRPELDRKLAKLKKKDHKRFEIIMNKAGEIASNPHHYKPLGAPLHGLRRVHIDSSFVLTFSIDEKARLVVLEDLDHHDRIYRNAQGQNPIFIPFEPHR